MGAISDLGEGVDGVGQDPYLILAGRGRGG